MHWVCMVFFSLIFRYGYRGRSGAPYYRKYLYEVVWSSPHKLRNACFGLLAMGAVAVVFVLTFGLARCQTLEWGFCVHQFSDQLKVYGFYDISFQNLIPLAVYFCTVNPVIEEFFWRLFLHREIGQLFYRLSQFDETTQSGGQVIYGALPDRDLELPENRQKNTLETSVVLNETTHETSGIFDKTSVEYAFEAEVSECGKLLVSFMYATYHMVVVGSILDSWIFSTFSLFGLLVLGRLCLFFRENPENFGMVGAVLFHVGMDVGVVAVFAIQYFNL
jgi:hypothetical protein